MHAFWFLIPLGYFSGSIPFGIIVTALFAGKDVRTEGSGNIGATNVARVAGKAGGALVLFLDALKGVLPVWAGVALVPHEPLLHIAIGGAAFLGHVFPLWLRFKGGKGVATALGVLLVLMPLSAVLGFVTWLIVIATTRISSVGSLLGAVVAIVSSFFFRQPLEYSLFAIGLLAAMLWTHRGNVERLLKHTERRF